MNPVSFLQSAEWQEIQERMGRATRRIMDVLVIRHDLPLGFNYLYAPRPPTLSHEFFQEAAGLAREHDAIFLKIDPTSPQLEIGNWKLEIQPSHSLQPRSTVVIDCRKPDAEILARMHPKTRYNIRLADRHEVMVRPVPAGESMRFLPQFLSLLNSTARRERFLPHPPEHYRLLLEVHNAQFWNELWLAEQGGTILAAALVNWYRPADTATYLHVASSREHRDKMAPQKLHWEIILQALGRGFGQYDLGGIDDKHWSGVTRFKIGFGGARVNFPHSCDIVFRRWWHRLYRLQRAFRR